MPFVDPKPKHRPFRRVLYREDSRDSTIIKDVSPRTDGQLLNTSRISNFFNTYDGRKTVMSIGSRKILMKEGTLYKTPAQQIKYVKRIRNDRMAQYLFHMQRYNAPSLSSMSRYGNNSLL